MLRWPRLLPEVRGERVVSALGALYVSLALGRAVLGVVHDGLPVQVAIHFVLVGVPGLALLYGGYRLPRTGLHRDVYPRIVAWCLGGAAVLLGVVGLLVLAPDVTVNRAFWSATLAAAVGNVGGLAIGTNEARAITRAREAEAHERKLQRQNDRLESFASMLAHELRNPLNIAQIYLPPAAEGDENAADEVDTALDRIEEMIDVLLVTARSSDSEIDGEDVSLAEVAEDAWADLSAESATLAVETDRVIRADAVHVRHLLENLFRNAVEHGSTGPRSGAHEDAVEHGSTSPRSGPHEDAVAHTDDRVTVRIGDLEDGFYVEDDGPGIPAAEREAVFEVGYTTETGGIGLGLTFVARLAETYGWDCTITESESGGARFEFTNVELAQSMERELN